MLVAPRDKKLSKQFHMIRSSSSPHGILHFPNSTWRELSHFNAVTEDVLEMSLAETIYIFDANLTTRTGNSSLGNTSARALVSTLATKTLGHSHKKRRDIFRLFFGCVDVACWKRTP
jgi:hypothetical protein